MSTKAQKINTRLIQSGCLLVVLFLSIPVIPRVMAQWDAAENQPVGGCFGSVFWDQSHNPATQPPFGVGSQQFEPAMAELDSQAADDFVISSSVYITGLRVRGEYSADGGPASSFNIYFYNNGAGNLPGTPLAAFPDLPYVETAPDFLICLPIPFGVLPGTYWVSVQARQDSNPRGQWFWHNRTVQTGAGAAWQNPGDGYGTGCITWNRKSACMADQVWPDQVFQILGFREGPLPTPRPRPTPRYRPTPLPRP